MNWPKRFLAATALMMLISGCGGPGCGARGLPPGPELEYGWSPPRSEIVEGKERAVRCLTDDDRSRLYRYIYLLEYEADR